MTAAPSDGAARSVVPGEVITAEDEISTQPDAARLDLYVLNTGDRPVQVGSHFHLAQANAALDFDRVAAYGFRLDVAAGTSVRFEPGIGQTVHAVAIGGNRIVPGLSSDAPGELDG